MAAATITVIIMTAMTAMKIIVVGYSLGGITGEGDVVGVLVGMLVGETVGLAVSAGVGETNGDDAGDMAIAVSADEDQYDLDPSKLATIVYFPLIGGSQIMLYAPRESLTTVPMSCELLLGSIAVNFTVTPTASWGIGFCMYRYSIHGP